MTTKNMSPEKQRIAIAEACGWKYIGNDPELYPYWLAPKGESRYGNPLDAELFPKAFPDYLTDLNAMHEAEKVLTDQQWDAYCFRFDSVGGAKFCAHATAAQRAEAFLRTIDKWDGK